MQTSMRMMADALGDLADVPLPRGRWHIAVRHHASEYA